MEDSLVEKIAAVRRATEIGCYGAHQVPGGRWLPCSSTKQFLTLTSGIDVKSRISIDDMENWSSIRKAKGRKRKKRWEKLRERRILGIDSLANGGLVSGNSRTSANAVSGGSIPSMTYGNTTPPNMSTKSIQPAYMPRDNDPDVFVDIESARKRAQQLGCIGVSRRMSKGGKTVWMPCTNLTDYNNLTGMTALGRINLQKRNDKIVRTIVKENLKKKKSTIQEEIYGKALGPRLRGVARAITSRFDANAIDGDEDGLIQDGTQFERPNVPKPSVPQANKPQGNVNIDPTSISAVRAWMSGMTPSQMEEFRGEPIDAYDNVPGARRGMASRGPGFIIDPKGPKQMGGKPVSKPIAIENLRNPEASKTNPFRNLGGKIMGRIIRGMVKPENKNKEERTTFIIGGNTGSGKSTVLDGHLIPNGIVPSSEEAAIVDPDFIKKGLVGYDDGAGAGRVHAESQTSADKTIKDAAQEGMDIVISGSGASRQLQHIREAYARGEKVIGHWVHVSASEASRRIKKRMDEIGRYIPDNTEHMSRSIPRAITAALEEELLEEFYLWDNDVPNGKPPRLIAKKLRGEEFEINDKEKFEEFAGGKERADSWVQTAEDEKRRSGLASKYDGATARKWLYQMGFEAGTDGGEEDGKKPEVWLPAGTPIEKFWRENILPYLANQSGRQKSHKGGKDGEPVVRDLRYIYGLFIDPYKIMDPAYRARQKKLILSSDPKQLAELFADAPINGPNGEIKFSDLKIQNPNIDTSLQLDLNETDEAGKLKQFSEKIGISERKIRKLMDKGFSLKEIEDLTARDIEELLAAD